MAHLPLISFFQKGLARIGLVNTPTPPAAAPDPVPAVVVTRPPVDHVVITRPSGDLPPRMVDGAIGDVFEASKPEPPRAFAFGNGIYPINQAEAKVAREKDKFSYYTGRLRKRANRLKKMREEGAAAADIAAEESQVKRYENKVGKHQPGAPQQPVHETEDPAAAEAYHPGYANEGMPAVRDPLPVRTCERPRPAHDDEFAPSNSACLSPLSTMTAKQKALAQELDSLAQSDDNRPHKLMELLAENQPGAQARADSIMTLKYWEAVGDAPETAYRAAELVKEIFTPAVVDWIGRARNKLDKEEQTRIFLAMAGHTELAAAYYGANSWRTFVEQYGFENPAAAGGYVYTPPKEGWFALAWILEHVQPTLHNRSRIDLLAEDLVADTVKPDRSGEIIQVLRWLEWLGDRLCIQWLFSHLGVQTRGGIGRYYCYRTPADDRGPEGNAPGWEYWDQKVCLNMWYGLSKASFNIDEQAEPYSDRQMDAERSAINEWVNRIATTLDSVLALSEIAQRELHRVQQTRAKPQEIGQSIVSFSPSMSSRNASPHWERRQTDQIAVAPLRVQRMHDTDDSFGKMKGMFRAFGQTGMPEFWRYDQTFVQVQAIIEKLSIAHLSVKLLDQRRFAWTPDGMAPIKLTHLEISYILHVLEGTTVREIDFGNYLPVQPIASGGEAFMELDQYGWLFKILIPCPANNPMTVALPIDQSQRYPERFNTAQSMSLQMWDIVFGPLHEWLRGQRFLVCVEVGDDAGAANLKRDLKLALEYKYAVGTAVARTDYRLNEQVVCEMFDQVKQLYLELQPFVYVYNGQKDADATAIDAARQGSVFQMDMATLFDMATNETHFDNLSAPWLVNEVLRKNGHA